MSVHASILRTLRSPRTASVHAQPPPGATGFRRRVATTPLEAEREVGHLRAVVRRKLANPDGWATTRRARRPRLLSGPSTTLPRTNFERPSGASARGTSRATPEPSATYRPQHGRQVAPLLTLATLGGHKCTFESRSFTGDRRGGVLLGTPSRGSRTAASGGRNARI